MHKRVTTYKDKDMKKMVTAIYDYTNFRTDNNI